MRKNLIATFFLLSISFGLEANYCKKKVINCNKEMKTKLNNLFKKGEYLKCTLLEKVSSITGVQDKLVSVDINKDEFSAMALDKHGVDTIGIILDGSNLYEIIHPKVYRSLNCPTVLLDHKKIGKTSYIGSLNKFDSTVSVLRDKKRDTFILKTTKLSSSKSYEEDYENFGGLHLPSNGKEYKAFIVIDTYYSCKKSKRIKLAPKLTKLSTAYLKMCNSSKSTKRF